jgi:predicted nucleic acid-binding protein
VGTQLASQLLISQVQPGGTPPRNFWFVSQTATRSSVEVTWAPSVGDIHSAGSKVRSWLLAKVRSGERVSCSVLVWAEYLCGPLSNEERELSWQLIEGSPIPLESFAAELSAQFFNSTGHRRGSLADCLIAATAVSHGATLLTLDSRDFLSFQPLGLRLADWQS